MQKHTSSKNTEQALLLCDITTEVTFTWNQHLFHVCILCKQLIMNTFSNYLWSITCTDSTKTWFPTQIKNKHCFCFVLFCFFFFFFFCDITTRVWVQWNIIYWNKVNLWRAWLLLNIAYFTVLHALGSWLAVNAICCCWGDFSEWICAVRDASSASQ